MHWIEKYWISAISLSLKRKSSHGICGCTIEHLLKTGGQHKQQPRQHYQNAKFLLEECVDSWQHGPHSDSACLISYCPPTHLDTTRCSSSVLLYTGIEPVSDISPSGYTPGSAVTHPDPGLSQTPGSASYLSASFRLSLGKCSFTPN